MPTATRASVSDALSISLPDIFSQSQQSVATHKKNVVRLHNLQLQAASITETTPKGPRLIGEKGFNTLFDDMLFKVLPQKKGVTQADRIVKFVGAFVAYAMEKGVYSKTLNSTILTLSSLGREAEGGSRWQHHGRGRSSGTFCGTPVKDAASRSVRKRQECSL